MGFSKKFEDWLSLQRKGKVYTSRRQKKREEETELVVWGFFNEVLNLDLNLQLQGIKIRVSSLSLES